MIFNIGIFSILYIMMKKRRFDFYSISIISSIIYFSPSLFGYVWYKARENGSRYEDIFLSIDHRVVIAHSIIIFYIYDIHDSV